MSDHAPHILTVGHSNRSLEELVELLHAHRVETIVDIRTVPRSRRNPQFSSEALARSLQNEGIGYLHLPELGGLRRPRPGSPNSGWRNQRFRGYADYMATPEFTAGLRRLLELATQHTVAIMCAEAVPWRCHRSLVADALTVQGVPVEHILSVTARRLHRTTPFARLDDGQITYPGPED